MGEHDRRTLEVDGLSPSDRERVIAWLADRVRACEEPVTFSPIPGGRSNLTYLIEDVRERRWVLRRPPLHSVLPTAHDVQREHRALTALTPTEIPVPAPVGFSADLLDAPFYVMEHVSGVVLRDAEDVRRHLPRERRAQVGEQLIETLAELHSMSPSDVGLGSLGRGTGYGQRQVRRWKSQASELRTRPRPVADAVAEELSSRLPGSDQISIVHGDYRLDNCIVEPESGRLLAIIDWELCTLGNPSIDLAVALSYWTLPDDVVRPLGDAPTLAEGFPSRDELIAAYGEARQMDVQSFDIYLAFAYWRLAMVLEGVHERFNRGAYGDIEDDGIEEMSGMVDKLCEVAQWHLQS